MDPSKIQLNVPISFFRYPNFGFITQLRRRPLRRRPQYPLQRPYY